MDIDDLIKKLAPFGFVIVWVAAAIFNKTQEVAQKAATPRPRPTPPNPFQQGNLDTATVAPQKPTQLDWSDLANPGQAARSRPPIKKPAAYRPPQPPKPRPAEHRTMQENLSRETRLDQAIPEMPADKMAVPQMQLLHLVPDHAAEVHLDPALAQHQSAVSQPKSPNNLQMQALMDRLKQPGTVREAMILSVILDEPKSKKMLHKG